MLEVNEFYIGTSAYKLEQYENYTRRNRENEENRKKQTKMEQMVICKYMVIGVMLMFIACSALVYVNVMTLRASTKIQNLERELALVIDNNKQKEIDINKNLDLKVIEKKAVEKLGMQKPDNSQIVYINVKKGSHSEAIGKNKVSGDAMKGIKETFRAVAEYFN